MRSLDISSVSNVPGVGFAKSMEGLADESRCLPGANGRSRRPYFHVFTPPE